MWTPLTLDYSSPKESQAPGLTRIKGGNGNGPETQQAGSLRPLRDTGPSGLKEKMANSRLKQIEKEYTQKLAKSSQTIAELQTAISSLKEESSRQQLAAERRLQDVTQKFEDEKKQLIRDNDRAIKALHSELENRANQVRCAEKKLQHKELEAQEQLFPRQYSPGRLVHQGNQEKPEPAPAHDATVFLFFLSNSFPASLRYD
uniref:Centrosomal protein 112 n=1 Tax=Molossus molossus TaxID=27622 RepID=A0A7J8CWU2_MOLMO|nr:centrosomal protein 112 [Molossus molossus]